MDARRSVDRDFRDAAVLYVSSVAWLMYGLNTRDNFLEVCPLGGCSSDSLSLCMQIPSALHGLLAFGTMALVTVFVHRVPRVSQCDARTRFPPEQGFSLTL